LVEEINFEYVYDVSKSACEGGWKYCFPNRNVPVAIELIGEYDTHRNGDLDKWENTILPFKYYSYSIINKVEDFPTDFFTEKINISECIDIGVNIMKYDDTMNESLCSKNSFDKKYMVV